MGDGDLYELGTGEHRAFWPDAVADEIERRVETTLEDPERFESSPREETVADRLDGKSSAVESGGGDDRPDEAVSGTPASPGDGDSGSTPEDDTVSPQEDGGSGQSTTDSDPGSPSENDDSVAPADGDGPEIPDADPEAPGEASDSEPAETVDGDPQASMEDYL